MIDIGNSELFYNTPMYPETRKVRENLIYKTLPHMPHIWDGEELRAKIKEVFDTDLPLQAIGHGLTSLRRGGYVETDKQNYRTWVKSYNRVTSKFSNTYFDVKA